MESTRPRLAGWRRRAMLEVRIWLVRFGFAVGRRLPARHRIVIATGHLGDLTGNLATIAEAMDRRGLSGRVVVLARRPGRGVLDRIRTALASAVAGYWIGRATLVVVDDYYFPLYVVPARHRTTVVQVWHACGAFKQFGYSVRDKTFGADDLLLDRVRIHGNYDVCLVSSMSVAPHYAEAFDLPLDRFRSDIGVPRTDILFDEAHVARARETIRARYAIPADRRVILYAPTFRGEHVTQARFADDLDLGVMRERLGGDHVLLVRLHPFIREAAPLGPELAGFAIDVSDHPDINELLLVSDVLITDYSSVIYEASLVGVPMVFFAPDYAAYELERGFYFDYRTGVPGAIFESTEPLADHIVGRRFDLARVEAFRAESFDVADGHATERFIDRVVLPAL